MIKYHGLVEGFKRSYRLYEVTGVARNVEGEIFLRKYGPGSWEFVQDRRGKKLFIEIETEHKK